MDIWQKIKKVSGKGVFVTGTNTGVGKTHYSCLLIKALLKNKNAVRVLKPLASGAEYLDGVLKNEDALKFQTLFPNVSYETINPICFEPAIAPHIAAESQGQPLSIAMINKQLDPILDRLDGCSEYLIVEGAGGWKTPLNYQETYADWVKQAKLPVIMVVSMELGCLSHAILTYESIVSAGLPVLGWVANTIDQKTPRYEENFATLTHMLPCPCVAEMDVITDTVPIEFLAES